MASVGWSGNGVRPIWSVWCLISRFFGWWRLIFSCCVCVFCCCRWINCEGVRRRQYETNASGNQRWLSNRSPHMTGCSVSRCAPKDRRHPRRIGQHLKRAYRKGCGLGHPCCGRFVAHCPVYDCCVASRVAMRSAVSFRWDIEFYDMLLPLLSRVWVNVCVCVSVCAPQGKNKGRWCLGKMHVYRPKRISVILGQK